MSRGGRRTTIGAQFAPRRIDMLRSSAYCALSLTARRVLDRLEIELADHGGTDNGRLPVTYDDFQRYGLHRQAIYPAISETVALGFVEVTEEGVAGGPEFRKPNLFRLTYRHSKGVLGDGSHEWKRIGENASEIAAQARLKRPPQNQKLKYASRQKSVRKPYRKRQINSTETTTTTHSTETTTTIDISSVKPIQPAREARPSGSAVASGPAATSAPASLASALALGERADIVLSRVAGRIGSGEAGWLIVQEATERELDNLIALESRGGLDEATLEATRLKYRRGAA